MKQRGAWRNQFTAGTAFDHSSVGFQQLSELGYLNPDRSVTGVGAFGDGVTGGNVDGEPFDTRVDLDGRINTRQFLCDRYGLGQALELHVLGPLQPHHSDNRDRIRPAGVGIADRQAHFRPLQPGGRRDLQPDRRA